MISLLTLSLTEHWEDSIQIELVKYQSGHVMSLFKILHGFLIKFRVNSKAISVVYMLCIVDSFHIKELISCTPTLSTRHTSKVDIPGAHRQYFFCSLSLNSFFTRYSHDHSLSFLLNRCPFKISPKFSPNSPSLLYLSPEHLFLHNMHIYYILRCLLYFSKETVSSMRTGILFAIFIVLVPKPIQCLS